MSISVEVTYVDGVTTVDADWLNLLQEHLAGFVNLRITAAGQDVTISAAPDNDTASVYIGGQMRLLEADLTFTFTGAESTDTYDVYVVGDVASDAFTMEVVSGAPAGTLTRKIAEVDYDTTLDEITDLRIVRGDVEEHDHTLLSGAQQVAHADLENLEAGDEHTQYILVDGTRDFTAEVTGVAPVADSDIATRLYVDGLVSSPAPVGTVVPYGGAAAPSGWALCDGTSYLVATYPILAALLDDEYGGDGGTNFNVPDLQGVFPYGKPDAGTGSSLGDTGGALDHDHTQPTHTHTESSHTHPITAHSHTNSDLVLTGAHTHSQFASQTTGSHTHVQANHTHTSLTYAVAASGAAVVGSRKAGTADAGLFPENDLDTASDSSSHLHGNGTYETIIYGGGINGNTGSNTASHQHYPGNAYQHTHASGNVIGSTDSDGSASIESSGDHYHSQPNTGSSGDHTHTLGATDTALTITSANTPGTTSADGDDTVGTNNPPFQVVNYIIKVD